MTMSSSVTALRARRAFPLLVSAEARERSIHRRIGIIWGLLVFNTATYMRGTGIIPLPSSIGKGIAQAALPVALIMVLTVNRKFVVRPNVFLGIVSLLVVEAILTSVEPQYFGTVYRTVRLAEFVAVLWLLTPWWGRRDMLLIRCHLKVLGIILGSVILGLVVAPGKALSQGRLTGALWPIWPTDVAHYAAVAGGLVIVLWLGGLIRGRPAAAGAVTAVAILVLSHTRTALIGLIAGILIAWPEPDRGQFAGPQALHGWHHCNICGCYYTVQFRHYLASPRSGYAAIDRAHRPDQSLGPTSGHSP